MLIVYCKQCLPDTKYVIGYGPRSEVDVPHEIHETIRRNGYFPIGSNDWKNTFVEGDDTQTKANIVANFGDKFVE